MITIDTLSQKQKEYQYLADKAEITLRYFSIPLEYRIKIKPFIDGNVYHQINGKLVATGKQQTKIESLLTYLRVLGLKNTVDRVKQKLTEEGLV